MALGGQENEGGVIKGKKIKTAKPRGHLLACNQRFDTWWLSIGKLRLGLKRDLQRSRLSRLEPLDFLRFQRGRSVGSNFLYFHLSELPSRREGQADTSNRNWGSNWFVIVSHN